MVDATTTLDHFRAKTRRLKIHPAEVGLLWIIGIQMVAMPWMLGSMRLWGQWVSFAFAILSFLTALLPRNYTTEHSGSSEFRLLMWPKLITFPLFWLGLALFGYIALQASNPAWVWRTNGSSFWMEAISASKGLPTSVRVPFEQWGPWRMLLVYAIVWLTICAMWVGFSRRRTMEIFFHVVAANGLALAVFGLAQRLVGNGLMFWLWKPAAGTFFASFIYKNHAGAYLDLTLMLTCGLAGWHYLRGLRRLEKSNPAGVFVFFALCIGVAVVVSFARGATLTMLVFLTVSVAAFLYHQFVIAPKESRRPIVLVAMILIFGGYLRVGLVASHSGIAWDRLEKGLEGRDVSLETRNIATEASLEMLRDRWGFGWGSGSFRFLFPIYQQKYPFIWMDPHAPKGYERRLYFDHAHNDLVEVPLELGVPGTILILGAFGWLGACLVRNYFWQNSLGGAVTFGLLLLVGYSRWDFPFQCPAILTLWWVLAVAIVMWTRFEQANVRS